MRRLPVALLVTLASALLAGCDLLGIEGASVAAERKAAEGKAVGAACRHAGRAIEDCYVLNKKAEKAAIYAGWREMDDYMRENKLEPVPPVLKPEAKAKAADELADEPVAKADAKPDTKADTKERAGKKVASSH
ncbi:MAG TPA: hypothetical protein VGQ91_10205 [Ideonella sp.]|jgi:hypothetical protein|nr:hypothetical protein [Ideonella sp.]